MLLADHSGIPARWALISALKEMSPKVLAHLLTHAGLPFLYLYMLKQRHKILGGKTKRKAV